MSIKSRHEVNQLFQQMQFQSAKVAAAIPGGLPSRVGLLNFEARLAVEDGAPSIGLRQIAQLTKHYLEELQTKSGRADPLTVLKHYDAAVDLLLKGYDVQQCIKKARNHVVRPTTPGSAEITAARATMAAEGVATL